MTNPEQTLATVADPWQAKPMTTEHDIADWDGDIDHYYEAANETENPNLLAMLTVESWVSSDADIVRAIQLLRDVQDARKESRS